MKNNSRVNADKMFIAGLSALTITLFAGIAPALAAQEDETSAILILRSAAEGPAPDLIAYDALVGGQRLDSASDFGFLQESDDGYAFAGIRVRISPGLEVTGCEGGLAPSASKNLFEGAYQCGEEQPVLISFNPKTKNIRPNYVDPNGVWEDESFFVGSIHSLKVIPARAISIAPVGIVRLTADDEPVSALDGLIGRKAPDHIQASGACRDATAVFFPALSLAGCAPTHLFE